jgi:tetratricopeptide (TPR) repeat protein
MRGALAEGVVPGLLREVYVGRRTGTLTLARGKERQSIRFRHGHIVNAQTNVEEERLGEMLVRRGLLSEADLALATTAVREGGRRLGEVLQERKLLDAGGLGDAVALHVHEMLTRVFAWTDGAYEFEEEAEERSEGELTLKLSTGELILESVQAVRDPDVVRYALGDMDRVLVLSTDPLLRFQSLTLSPADGFVLSRVDGVTSAREIVQMIPLAPEQTQKSLLGLISTGVVEYAAARRPRDAGTPPGAEAGSPPAARATPSTTTPTPPAAEPKAVPEPKQAPLAPPPAAPTDDAAAERRREILEAHKDLKTRNHFEVLGLPRSAGEAEVKEAYFRLAKRFHPDVHHGDSLGDLRDELEKVFIRLGEAYDVLRDPDKRRDYEQRLGRPRPKPAETTVAQPAASTAEAEPAPPPPDPEEQAAMAEQAIRRAVKLFEMEKYWDAIQLVDPALEAARGKVRVLGQLTLARCRAKNPKWAKEAETVLLAATREDPRAVEAWALLAELYAQRGMRNRALTMYRKVLELNPDHEDAVRYVAASAPDEDAPPGEGSGLLGRLFRRG